MGGLLLLLPCYDRPRAVAPVSKDGDLQGHTGVKRVAGVDTLTHNRG